jgi:hypothetical protein
VDVRLFASDGVQVEIEKWTYGEDRLDDLLLKVWGKVHSRILQVLSIAISHMLVGWQDPFLASNVTFWVIGEPSAIAVVGKEVARHVCDPGDL